MRRGLIPALAAAGVLALAPVSWAEEEETVKLKVFADCDQKIEVGSLAKVCHPFEP